jgi:heme-degrading monooxygenase HmoA
MIVRLWHGRVAHERAEAYREFLVARAIPDYRGIDGNLGVRILERRRDDATHFVTLTFWRDYAAIRAFAGEAIERAKYYPEDAGFLLEYEPEVVHYEVVGEA